MSISISSSFLLPKSVVAVRILPAAQSGPRRPFHLTLVLDKSGSMEGARITAVKRTLHLLIDAMADGDILSIVSYSHESHIDANGIVLSDAHRALLHGIVDGMVADGGTNLESAFTALSTVVATRVIDAVFVLTDGQINQGIAGSTGLQRILGSILPAGTPVNTLGFGADHNARLLRDIAMRSRGSYTYADADEMLPAIIGDIMGGLASEIGRKGILTIPAGWKCLELGAAEGDTHYTVGTLIAEKEQWVVLEGPVGSVPPTFEFQWSRGSDVETVIHTTDESIPAIVVAEQYDRVHVATVFNDVTDLLENGQIEDAKMRLVELGAYLETSVAKTRHFVVRLHAQVDEMLESIESLIHPAYNNGYPPPPPFGRFALAPPPLAPMLSRMASNTSALGVQRGFFTLSGGPDGQVDDTFSSPSQSRATRSITAGYTQDPL
jgi:hypothetical protein